MPLTLTQFQTIKVWLLANAGSLNDQQAADALNADATPPYYIYKISLPVEEVMSNGFDWTRVDNLSVGKARIWEWMTRARQVDGVDVIDPSKPHVRAGINETWKGTAADLAVRAVVYTHVYEAASVTEKLLATGLGVVPDANGEGPGTPGFVGTITPQDVVDAYNS